MFETLQPAPADKILALIGLYHADTRPGKVDLGVGVYKDRNGRTPVMRAVREAEKRLLAGQDTKTYLGLAGDIGFNAAMIRLAFGDNADHSRIRAAQAPGGSGALRLVAELLQRTRPGATVWLSDPTWPNHLPVMRAAGLQVRDYPYFDAVSGAVRFDDMLAALKTATSGDVVLLHGCCHNPTGANLDAAQWAKVADVLLERGLLPFVDIAYQGFGEGLDADAAGLRLLAGKVPEMVVASSCSKNFAVYRDRVGSAMIMAKDGAQADVAMSQMLAAARALYSMPPDHGAAAVRMVLEDADLKKVWETELEEMRLRMLRLRVAFAEALRRQSNSDRFDFVASHRGMFSRLGLTEAQVERLRTEHAVYMVGDSRINVAGLPEDGMDELAKAIVSVLD
ncbi:MAG: aminotransferase class I/II-fold pyridoxal phosphate-dependent enzyme [Mesorhizobium sp.]|uniref:amino acid aminotransferase n=1 Tax=unclassified Mesorhizobium TaxID=325217 RepID=UPI000F754CE1|nr:MULTISPECIES: amino acid aminotransferase [unclassified Mesorhizobium]TGV87064.1 aspartate/tyrosine/aromatic aminotransferase [Mesorhizobium sp. M00.F.Ca.ET.158.01.1.1]AZO57912.1 aspartate/tyrosine/aromatic aminotransferase [Mesorhizobium sp. M1A.F.Ca.IN.022.06.1.1]MCT2578530.1 aspartate/tyrosine/aromatic aminotransferase [Mesorhizobium sp. P13.3]MDF3167455.1 aspartate/tyrosine/aromatic aminotransferase [Mesorhizobium sp. P16.1]MDF3184368.1 aspartate/tyrosine/aromatic aminotransferase [Meso